AGARSPRGARAAERVPHLAARRVLPGGGGRGEAGVARGRAALVVPICLDATGRARHTGAPQAAALRRGARARALGGSARGAGAPGGWGRGRGATPRGGRDRRALLDVAWRTLVECQFHDAIGGCASDDVARAVEAR